MFASLSVTHLGRLAYEPAYRAQLEAHARVLAARGDGPASAGELLLVEHEPVITISNRSSGSANLLATPELLARAGVSLAQTDRGGDITYHGPGQLVAYPILDLNRLNLGLHEYMRLLEETVIAVCGRFGVPAVRDPGATGVWTVDAEGTPKAKIAAMGVRVRKWVSMHGLAINVSTNLEHFRLIVPCGLAGRPVTSLRQELGAACPAMPQVETALVEELTGAIERQAARAARAREAAEKQ
ncbi:MAG: lipoyl(octanoyl) transferase LipB [Planctomycetes bacterium]|nr:lipoyl(octanoyl) transferase LipB [Planctomycetota bacterium]